ncbi:MAG: cyclase family protein [Armatimonadota bacterium]
MRIIDLTHTVSAEPVSGAVPRVIVRWTGPVELVPLDRLVTLASVVDLTSRMNRDEVSRADVSRFGLAGIAGCVIRTGWCDCALAGSSDAPPRFSVDAAGYLLENGVSTVAADFPIAGAAAELLLHNECVLVYCLSGLANLTRAIVRLIALPLKLEGRSNAEARVIAIEE